MHSKLTVSDFSDRYMALSCGRGLLIFRVLLVDKNLNVLAFNREIRVVFKLDGMRTASSTL